MTTSQGRMARVATSRPHTTRQQGKTDPTIASHQLDSKSRSPPDMPGTLRSMSRQMTGRSYRPGKVCTRTKTMRQQRHCMSPG